MNTAHTAPHSGLCWGPQRNRDPTSGSWRAPSLPGRPFQASFLLETQGVGGWPAPPIAGPVSGCCCPPGATHLCWVPTCQAPEAAASPPPWRQRGQDPRGGRRRPGRSRPQQLGSPDLQDPCRGAKRGADPPRMSLTASARPLGIPSTGPGRPRVLPDPSHSLPSGGASTSQRGGGGPSGLAVWLQAEEQGAESALPSRRHFLPLPGRWAPGDVQGRVSHGPRALLLH